MSRGFVRSGNAAVGGRRMIAALGPARDPDGPQVPGLEELNSICANARRIIELCELVKIGEGPLDPPGHHELVMIRGHHVHTRDHVDPPYEWEV